MIDPPALDEPEPVADQLQAIADQHGVINPLTAVQWELRDGRLVHIFGGIVLDTRPWETQWNCNRITLALAGSKVAGRALP
jgi:hypothetical protein